MFPFNNSLIISKHGSNVAPYIKIKPFTASTTTTEDLLDTLDKISSGDSVLYTRKQNDLDENRFAQMQMTEYLLYKLYDEMIYTSKFKKILEHFTILNDKVLVKKNKGHGYTKNEIKLIADYTEKNILNTTQLNKLLHHLVKKKKLKWFKMYDDQERMFKLIRKKLLKKLEEL